VFHIRECLDIKDLVFTVLRPAQELHYIHEDVIIAGEGLQKSGLRSGPFSGEESLCATPAVTRGLVFSRFHPKDHLLLHTRGCAGPILTRILTGPLSVASYNTQVDAEDLFLPGSSRVQNSPYQWKMIGIFDIAHHH
jgi:hypothetical protein